MKKTILMLALILVSGPHAFGQEQRVQINHLKTLVAEYHERFNDINFEEKHLLEDSYRERFVIKKRSPVINSELNFLLGRTKAIGDADLHVALLGGVFLSREKQKIFADGVKRVMDSADFRRFQDNPEFREQSINYISYIALILKNPHEHLFTADMIYDKFVKNEDQKDLNILNNVLSAYNYNLYTGKSSQAAYTQARAEVMLMAEKVPADKIHEMVASLSRANCLSNDVSSDYLSRMLTLADTVTEIAPCAAGITDKLADEQIKGDKIFRIETSR